MEKVICNICKKEVHENQAYLGGDLRKSLFTLIKKVSPGFAYNSFICRNDLNKYRKEELTELIREESGELNSLEKEVVEPISANKLLSENIEPEIKEELTFDQRMADHIAAFGGSCTFIIIFLVFLLMWMAESIWVLANRSFDPYPFILLNLILSCLAAIQASIIMMSQNRQEQKDIIRSEHDYKISLKAELEIKLLNEKLDHLLIYQNRRLMKYNKYRQIIYRTF